MKPKRWDQVKDLFQQALEKPAEHRADFVREVSGDDTTLRIELESLLASHDDAGTFLSSPPGTAAAEVIASEEGASMTGRRLGPYRVLHRVGRGGTGSVYLAVRDDDEFQQRVALKVIRRGMATEETLQRFRSERQILASIDHPNIARLLDGGSTDEGLPYFVMEYIEGEPLHHYCDNNRLPLGERIKLFCEVCKAVRLAHQNLVVHRDLKPGNILVTADGTPKLLDFGIAKLLNPELSADTHEPTMLELRVMTPEYASPEQMQGRAVNTSSDVYSLGVLLYELLSGHRPYSVSNLPLHEMEIAVSTTEPDVPSIAVGNTAEQPGRDGTVREITPESVARARDTTPDKLRRDLVGDLDNIVLKALRKEPPRRYSSVEKLAEDLENHMFGRPVEARPDTFGYRAGKFVRRHTVPSAIAATALLFGVVLTATIWVQSQRVAVERDRAEHAAVRAEGVATFLQDVLAAADPIEGMGREVSVLAAMEAAVPQIQASFADEPEIEAAIRHTIGYTFARLGRLDVAEEQLRQALALRRQLHGTSHPEIADTLNALGEVRYDLDDMDAAERLYTEALNMRRAFYGNEGAEVAASLDNLGNVLHARGRLDEAEQAYRDGLAMREAAFGREHKDVSGSLNNIATILHDRDDLDGAEELYRESLAISRVVLGDDHPETATGLNNLAMLLADRDKPYEAEHMFRDSLQIARDTLGRDHPGVVISIENLAGLLAEMKRYDEAVVLFEESLAISARIWGEQDVRVASGHGVLGDLAFEQDAHNEAVEHYDQALAIFVNEVPGDDPEMVYVQADKGLALTQLGRYAEAEECLTTAYNAFLTTYGAEDEDVLEFAGDLADLYDKWGRAGDAARYRAIASGAAVAEHSSELTARAGQ